jgi:hypothetical protein
VADDHKRPNNRLNDGLWPYYSPIACVLCIADRPNLEIARVCEHGAAALSTKELTSRGLGQ